MHRWHQEQGAEFEDVGQWKRPWYFPQQGETMQDAVNREGLAVRNSVGILDATTLGKIDIQGPDAAEFITRMYSNSYLKLAPGKCRYGVMLKEDGMIFDDGVCACLGENHYLMFTTTGGAAGVLAWLELVAADRMAGSASLLYLGDRPLDHGYGDRPQCAQGNRQSL